jgi:uncharacterized membrane protein YkvA (DUF1232 family)
MKKKISKSEAAGEIRKGMGKFSEDDLANVVKKEKKIKNKFLKAIPLKRFLKDFLLLFALIKDYYSGYYREIPWWTIAAIGVALLYVLNPFDLIPDFIPGAGYLDDAAVIAACLNMAEKDIDKYQLWSDDKNNS